MINELEAAIGYRFQNITLLQNALAHSSYANERWHDSLKSNERLEFLGDSILGMVVAEHLYRNFPDRPEGELTRMRADMVCENSLAAVAEKIGTMKQSSVQVPDSCTVFAPSNPATGVPVDLVLKEEAKIPDYAGILEKIINDIEIDA